MPASSRFRSPANPSEKHRCPSNLLQGNKTSANEIKRRESHSHPKKHSLRQRAPTNFPERRSRNARADQEQGSGQPVPSQRKKQCREMGSRGNVRVHHRGQAEKQDEPGKFDPRGAALN